MIQMVALDTGPLGLLTHPRRSAEADACSLWLEQLLANRVRVVLPEIADYELRREYHLRGNRRGMERLDAFGEELEFLKVTTPVLRRAAILWAQTRQAGRPTSDAKALDGDCILVAQVRLAAEAAALDDSAWMIATTDVGDLPFLAPAARWQDIPLS